MDCNVYRPAGPVSLVREPGQRDPIISEMEPVNVTSNAAPKVSVGLPVYNGDDFVEQAIVSILQQTLQDFELVISDNASTDRTQDICRSYAAKDRRIKYFRVDENVGACQNFNRVFALSRAPYFKWACHDDLCAPELLEKCVAVLDNLPDVVACYPRSAFIDELGAFLAGHSAGCNLRSPRVADRVSQYFREGSPACHPIFGVMRRSALQKTSLIGPYINSDVVLILELALLGKVYEVPEQLFFCREHSERTCTRFDTYAELAAWHDPRKGHRWQFPRWRLALEFFRSINRAEVGRQEAAACYLSALKWCRWHYRPFIRDLILVGRNTLRSRTIDGRPAPQRAGAGSS